MRPIASEQNPLRYPLNEIFARKSMSECSGVMTVEVEGPLTASDIAKRAGLTVPGAQKALTLSELVLISEIRKSASLP